MADPTPTPTPDPAPDPAPTPDPPNDPTPTPDDGKGGKDAILADLAKERDKRQALETTVTDMQTKQQEQMDALAKALGLKADDAPPDPTKLAEQITAEQSKTTDAEARATSAERQLAVFKAAPALDANAVTLLDSTAFLDSIKDVDHADTDALGEAIKKAVERDDRFKATPPTPAFPGGPRTPGARPEPSPGLGRLRDAYAQSSK
jgi:hypothetical protein